MNHPVLSGKQRRFSTSGLRASLISAFFVLLTLALLATPAAGPMRYGFPALSFVFAYLVYRQSKPFYAGFVVWLWMLAPLVRRLIEWRAGGVATLVIASPFLACAVPFLLNLTSIGELLAPEGYPTLLAAIGIAYGLGVGVLLHNHLALIAPQFAYWIAPLLFTFFILRFRLHIHEIRASMERAFIWGSAFIGAYGLYQYFFLPPWDALWMQDFGLVSYGLPEPQQVRVFSTMNSPQLLAAFLVAGIFFAIKSQSKIKWLAIPTSTFTLLLTGSRTAWVGFIAGFGYLFFYLPIRQKLQITAAGVLSAILLFAALQGPQKEALNARIQTLASPGEDNSVSSRLAGYAILLPEMVSFPFGTGVGIDENSPNSPTSKAGEGLGYGDSSIIAILFGLGFPGAIVYLIGVGFGVSRGFGGTLREDVGDILTSRAIIISLMLSALATDVIQGGGGFLTWTAIMLASTRLVQTVPETVAPPTSSTRRRLFTAPQVSLPTGRPSLGPRIS